MVPAFMIMLREGLEAALIVGIVAAYLVKTGRRDSLPAVWIGVAAAVILEHGIDRALVGGSLLGLAGVAFVSVAREGLETVLFMSVVFSAAAPGPEPAIGAVLGLAVAVGIGIAIFAFGVRVDLRRFFQVTAVILIFVAAGLCAYAVHEFGEAGVIANTGTLFDISDVLPESSPIGAVLAGLFGYRSAPTSLEVLAYFAYLIPVVTIYLVTDRPRQSPRPVTA